MCQTLNTLLKKRGGYINYILITKESENFINKLEIRREMSGEMSFPTIDCDNAATAVLYTERK